MTDNHQHKQNRIPCDCHSKAQVEHTDTAHKLPQQRKQYHHGQNLYRSAKCTEKCIAVIPALPTHIILEKIQQQIGRNIQRAVNQYNGDDNRHCLIVVNQRRKHLPYGRCFHMNRGFFPDRQTGDRNKQHKQYRNNKCKPAETHFIVIIVTRAEPTPEQERAIVVKFSRSFPPSVNAGIIDQKGMSIMV